MKPLAERHVRIAVTKVAYDLVLSATTDAGVAKLTGTGRVIHHRTQETLQELGEIDVTIWGSTTEQLKTRAKTWPKHFDYVTGDYFGVATAGDHRFDVFVNGERFMRLLDLAHGSDAPCSRSAARSPPTAASTSCASSRSRPRGGERSASPMGRGRVAL